MHSAGSAPGHGPGLAGRLRRLAARLPMLLAAALGLGLGAAPARAQSLPTGFSSVEIAPMSPGQTTVRAYLNRIEPAAGGRSPLVLALHGCGGVWNSRGQMGKRYRDYQAWFQSRGISFLLLDSFTPRGKPAGICTEPTAQRDIHPEQRRIDVHNAMHWLSQQAWVDASRILVLGWSHGGSTTLASIDRSLPWPEGLPDFRAAVAFYPGCTPASQRDRYQPGMPLLLMIGESDDWTPARPCILLHERQQARLRSEGLEETRFEFKLYPGAYHGFDGTDPLRVRADVPNGQRRGRGVTVGGDPAARADALQRLDAFIKRWL